MHEQDKPHVVDLFEGTVWYSDAAIGRLSDNRGCVDGSDVEIMEVLAKTAASKRCFLAIGVAYDGFFVRYRKESDTPTFTSLCAAIEDAAKRAVLDTDISVKLRNKIMSLMVVSLMRSVAVYLTSVPA